MKFLDVEHAADQDLLSEDSESSSSILLEENVNRSAQTMGEILSIAEKMSSLISEVEQATAHTDERLRGMEQDLAAFVEED